MWRFYIGVQYYSLKKFYIGVQYYTSFFLLTHVKNNLRNVSFDFDFRPYLKAKMHNKLHIFTFTNIGLNLQSNSTYASVIFYISF